MKSKFSYFKMLFILFCLIGNSYGDDYPLETVIQSGHSQQVISVAIFPDGKYLVTGCAGGTAKLWELASGRVLRTFAGHLSSVNSVAISPDGKSLVTGSMDHTAKLWEIDTGREIRAFTGHSDNVTSVAISPDGKYLVTASVDKTAKLWDIQTGHEIRSFVGHSSNVNSVAISPDGKYVMSGSWDETIKQWDLHSGREIRTFVGHFKGVTSVAISPDGKYLVSGSGYEPAKIWDIHSGCEIRTFTGHSKGVDFVAISPDGKYLVTGRGYEPTKLLDINSGREIRTFAGHSNPVHSVAISPDGKYLVTGSLDHTAKLWDIDTGREIRTYVGNLNIVHSVAISPDGKYVVTGSVDNTIKLWDIRFGQGIRTFAGYSFDIFPDGKYLVTIENKNAKLLDIRTSHVIRTFAEHSSDVYSEAITPDGKYLVTGSRDDTAKLWEIETGLEIQTFVGHGSGVISLAISPDGKFFVTGNGDHTAKLWEIDTGREIRTFTGHSSTVYSVAVSPDGKYLVTGSEDGTAKLWDIHTGKEHITLISFGKDDWVVTTLDGFFDCSEGAKKYIHFVKGTDVYELDQFFEDFYRPGLLAEVMSGKDLKRPDLSAAEQLTQSPPPTVEIISPIVGETFTQKEIEIIVKITDNGGGIDEAVLLHNNKRVAEDTRGFQVAEDDKNSVTRNYKVELLDGENVFRTSAFSKGRIESRGYELSVFFKGVTATANSYVFVIGIDQYKNPKYNLQCAQADAAGVKDLIVSKSAKLFQNTFIHELYNSDANSNNIKSIFNEMKPKIQPQDVFTFFYAGHGVMVPDESGKEQFYLIPTEVTSFYDEEKVHQSGISGKQLVQFSSQIAARKQLFIIDACQAGGISDDFAMNRGFAEEKALAQLARSAGIHVIASSKSDQYASEFSELGHGLFTYAIIQAFNGQAEAPPPDGKITIYEIKAYLENVIPDLSRKYKGQAQYPVSYTNGQDFPVVVE